MISYKDELYHHGIKGQKWGIRRFVNEDGTLTEAGKAHYKVGNIQDVRKKIGEYNRKYYRNAAILGMYSPNVGSFLRRKINPFSRSSKKNIINVSASIKMKRAKRRRRAYEKLLKQLKTVDI